MGAIKQKLIELEDEGIIRWSDDLSAYVFTKSEGTKPFDIDQYMRNRNLKLPYEKPPK